MSREKQYSEGGRGDSIARSTRRASARYIEKIIHGRISNRTLTGLLAHPVPGRLDDCAQILLLRLPSQFLLDFFRARNQYGRVACAPWPNAKRNRMPGHLPRRLNNFENCVASPTPQIEDSAFPRQHTECQHVSASQIAHMNVVAHAGAVAGGIIVAENFKRRALSGGDLQE